MNLSKNDYKILIKLFQDDCTNEMKSYSIKRLCELTELSTNKIRLSIKTFQLIGYIKEGCNQHNAKTYYITKEGIEKLNSLK